MDNSSLSQNQNMPTQHNKKVVMILMTLVMLGIGVFAGYLLGSSSKTSDMTQSATTLPSTTTKAAELRTTLNNLLREHVTTNLAVTHNIVSGVSAAQLQASVDAQTANASQIADAVGSIYGDEAKKAVATPFLKHLEQSNDFAKAVAANDMTAQASALTALQASLREVADAFHSVIPSASSDVLYKSLDDHEKLMNEVAEAYKASDYKKAYEVTAEALKQISGGADALASGIVSSKPDMFKE